MVIKAIDRLGAQTLSLALRLGEFSLFVSKTIKTVFTSRLRIKATLYQVMHIGVESASIVILTSTFTGLVIALQIYLGFHRFGADDYIGTVVAMSMIRELGPVLAALMVTARAGSSMAAELGTMQITEQIDALKTLGINPFQYLITPRIVASVLALPCLTLFSMACGVGGGYIFCVYGIEVSHETFMASATTFAEVTDITGGIIKAAVFGLIISSIACYYGYTTSGGAKGVGRTTTQTVVASSILILVINYFLSSLLF